MAYIRGDTIAGAATAAGGALAVVRVSGPAAFSTAVRLTRCPQFTDQRPRLLVHRSLYKLDCDQDILDHALVVRFPNPSSFTGEDVVEYQIHGGSYVTTALLGGLRQLGVRPAEPGEFSYRAVLNQKMTRLQAEALADLIEAQHAGAARLALEKFGGAQATRIQSFIEPLRDLAAACELGIDFVDQDVPELEIETLRLRLVPLVESISSMAQSFHRGQKLQEGWRVVCLGLPNVGKSSFFNALMGEDRALVSNLAGTTRDCLREVLRIRVGESYFVLQLEDTAGVRDAADPLENLGIERTLERVAHADLLLFLADGQSHPAEHARAYRRALGDQTVPVLGIWTKADLQPDPSQLSALQSLLPIRHWVSVSSVTGAGIESAVKAMGELLGASSARAPGELWLTRPDQAACFERCLAHLARAQACVSLDLLAADLRLACAELQPLIGATTSEDLLGRIFSRFCIGK